MNRDRYTVILGKILRARSVLMIRYLLSKIGLKYVTYFVFEIDLNKEILSVQTKIPIEFEIATENSIKQNLYNNIKFVSGDDPILHNEALRRIAEGDICFVGRVNGIVSAISWISFKEKHYEPEIEKEEIFTRDEALIYRRVVFPKYRRNDISKKLTEISLRYLKINGYKKAKVYIASDNVFSIKSFTPFGFHPTRKITCIRILNYKKILDTSFGVNP